jgi:hypothetical protein
VLRSGSKGLKLHNPQNPILSVYIGDISYISPSFLDFALYRRHCKKFKLKLATTDFPGPPTSPLLNVFYARFPRSLLRIRQFTKSLARVVEFRFITAIG